MNTNFHKNNEAMSEKHCQSPPELEWEQMEAGILQKMEELEATTPPLQGKPWKKTLSFGIGLAVLLLLIPMVCTQISSDIELDKAAFSVKKITEKASNITNNHMSETVVLSENERVIANENHTLVKKAKAAKIENETTISNLKNREQTPLVQKKYKEKTTQIKGNKATSKDEKLPIAEALKLEKSDDLSVHQLLEQQRKRTNISPINPLATRQFSINSTPKTTFSTNSLPAFSTEKNSNSNAPKTKARLSFLSGVSAWNMGYGSTKPIRDTYEKNLISYHLQLNYIHSLKKNFILLTGLQFQQLENRLNWNKALSNYNVTVSDAILAIELNVLTGEEAEVKGQAELTVPAKRVVQHYNATQLVQIPLAIGKTWGTKKWQADILIGGTMNIFSKNKGRTIYQGMLQDYDGTKTDFLKNQWAISAQFNSLLTYKINENFGIATGLQFQKGLTNWSREQNIKMRPNMVNLEVGLSYFIGK